MKIDYLKLITEPWFLLLPCELLLESSQRRKQKILSLYLGEAHTQKVNNLVPRFIYGRKSQD